MSQKRKRIRRINGAEPPALTDEAIAMIKQAAEHTRLAILGSAEREIATLENMLAQPEITADHAVLAVQGLAAIRTDSTSQAWLAFFAVYQQHGIIPKGKVITEEEAPPPEDLRSDAEKFAEKTAQAAADDAEEKQATIDLAAERERLKEERGKKH